MTSHDYTCMVAGLCHCAFSRSCGEKAQSWQAKRSQMFSANLSAFRCACAQTLDIPCMFIVKNGRKRNIQIFQENL